MGMKIYNTLTRRVEELVPLEAGHVRMYTCGPTVYNFAHIGNFRAYMFEDILRRAIKYAGFRVTQVMNLTDVDDKTIRGAAAGKVSLDAYTRPFKDAFFEDLRKLNIEAAEVYPAATDHIPEMIAMIGQLFERGYAYRSDDGSIYFNVGRFAGYGKLAHLDMDGLRAGARVAQDEYDKENVADFALWKAWDPADGDVVWDSPWGRGRPGWHLECSAMSTKYLGPSFDLHTGGIDNMFPHHENEIAQSEGATGKTFVTCWMHCGYLLVNGTKMSKSLGNFYTLRDILQMGYTGRELRYLLLAGHYRQSLNFTFDALNAARAALARLDEFRNRLAAAAGGGAAGAAPEWAEAGRAAFKDALFNDLNMSEALSAVFEIVHTGNRLLDGGGMKPADAAAALAVYMDMDRVLGCLQPAGEEPPPDEVMDLARQRGEARKTKDWAEADRIRLKLAELGWEVRDTPEGIKVRRKAT